MVSLCIHRSNAFRPEDVSLPPSPGSMMESKSKRGASILQAPVAAADTQSSLYQQIRNGLSSIRDAALPSQSDEFAYSKTIPTMVLYDDAGLEIYKGIERLPGYYLFNAELDLLKQCGSEIAECLCPKELNHSNGRNGLPEEDENEDSHREENRHSHVSPDKPACSDSWGDYNSGRNNHGVNGNFGLSNKAPSRFLVELGAGSGHKTSQLLRSIAKRVGDLKSECTYYAVDLEQEQLVVTLDELLETESANVSASSEPGKVTIKGIRASYEETRPLLGGTGTLVPEGTAKTILWLGSSIGNFTRDEAADFLKSFVDEALKPGDQFLIGVDCTDDVEKIEAAYGDPGNVTKAFVMNGLTRVARIFEDAGESASIFDPNNFDYINRFNVKDGCHEAYYRAKQELSHTFKDGKTVKISKNENILIERSYKYNQSELSKLFDQAGLRQTHVWRSDKQDYRLVLCEKPPFHFPVVKQPQSKTDPSPFSLPSLEDWEMLWRAFDNVTLDMIPEEMLFQKPIDLRHICLFYIGHIPTFLQIHLSRQLGEGYTEPAEYTQIFERGIDPNMDDPSQCHDHSIVPETEEEWPRLSQILDYRDRVRLRLRDVYQNGKLDERNKTDRRLARAVAMVYEHEALHLETLLYMLLQKSDKINPPSSFAVPNWKALAREWDRQVAADGKEARSAKISFDATTISMGILDKDVDDTCTPYCQTHTLGWDNESGVREVKVAPFKISALPISNAEYLEFLKTKDCDAKLTPSSWYTRQGEHKVRVVFAPGYVSFDVAQHWPVQASGQQLAAYAKYKGGRLPFEPELRLFMDQHIGNCQSPNNGFKNWHPVPSALSTVSRDGRRCSGHNGGVWEWTQSNFEHYEGFSSSILYPGYSSDFFDNTHSVILGGSWATIPRIASRPSLRNWYQTAYPYVFAGARVVYDL